jgi:hypothetical protein
MPTASLTFNLPEESAEHQMALDGWKWKSIVSAILDNLRQDLKYNSEKLTADQQKVLENMRGYICQQLTEENLSLDY